ncbi:MAG: alpha/beta fold hydrolase [Myxococcota bacterium]
MSRAVTVQHRNPEAAEVFVFAHPATSYENHFLTEALVSEGVGVLNVDGRFVGEPHDLNFEDAALDIAQAIDDHAAKARKVILTGHSGGGPLMTLTHVRLGVGDGLVLLAAHPSRGHILEAWIDPCLREDGTRDPALDLYRPRALPLDPEFVQRYRRAQRRRMARLADEAARYLRRGQPEARVAFPHACADPRFIDATLDPNGRDLAAFPFGDPADANQRPDFFGGWVTARSFLNQWYVPTTPANGPALAPHVRVPTLHISFGADGIVFPSQTTLYAERLPAAQTEVETLVDARHNPRSQPELLGPLAGRLSAWARAL